MTLLVEFRALYDCVYGLDCDFVVSYFLLVGAVGLFISSLSF